MAKKQHKMTITLPTRLRAALLREAAERAVASGKRVSMSGLIREALENAGYGRSEPEGS